MMPNWPALKQFYQSVHKMTESGRITAASVVREGGVAAAVSRMCFGNKIGFRFEDSILNPEFLFAPCSGSIVAELADGTLDALFQGFY